VKNWRKTISIEERLDIISHLEKGEQLVDICRNVSFGHSSVCKIHKNGDRITESAKSGTKMFV
jgi:hypothetical protein